MFKYSWIWLGGTRKLTNTEYSERRKWYNSFFNQKQKYRLLQILAYTDSLKILAPTVFSLPAKVEKVVTLGFKEVSSNAGLVWLLTPLMVLRFYLPIMVRQPNSATPFNSLSLITQKKTFWVFPKYGLGKGCLARWSRTRTLFSSSIVASLFSFAITFSIVGYNYSVQYKGGCLVFILGYSHTNIIKIPKGVFIKTFNRRQLYLYGANKLIVTTFASRLSNLKKLNIFTGKGLKSDSKNFKIKKRGS